MRVVYRRRREQNPVHKRGKARDIRIGILIPIPYRAAISSLFLHYAYIALNSLEGVVAYRYVYDMASDTLESLDTSEPITKLDALLVSLPFELDYVSLARIELELGLAPRKGFSKPIVIAGGVAPSANPLPLTNLVDAVVIGDAEPVLESIAYAVADEPSHAMKELEDLNCIYIPQTGGKARRCVAEDLDRAPHPVQQIVPLDEEPVYGYGLRIEVSRGCRRFCAFCLEGHVSIPFRYRSLAVLKRIAEIGLEYQPRRRVVIYSLSLFDIPHATQFLEYLAENSIEASIPSLRPDYLDRDRIELIYRLGQRTLTVAPETMVRDLGCAIGKCVDRERVVELALDSFRIGFSHLKLYLVLGFPCEDTSRSIDEVKRFVEDLRRLGISRAKFIRFSINPLIPKPWTPLQNLAPSHVLKLGSVLEKAREVLTTPISEVEVMDVEWGFAQAVIALGSSRTSELIMEWGLRGLGIRGFREAFERCREFLRYVDSGWDTPPWIDAVEAPLPLHYFENRFGFLSRSLCSRR